jgi:hypothetical protein
MISDTALIADILGLPPAKKAEIAEHVERLKRTNGNREQAKNPRRPPAGSMPGLFRIMPGFDDPIPGLEEYM